MILAVAKKHKFQICLFLQSILTQFVNNNALHINLRWRTKEIYFTNFGVIGVNLFYKQAICSNH
jgi:hypothetical protein